MDPTAYIDPTAQVIGNVHIGARVYVGPNAVIRADESDDKGKVHSIEIGAECNIQDGVIIHALGGTQLTVGLRTSLAHGCIVHGPCTIGQGCFVGFGSKVFSASLEDEVYVGTNAVVQWVVLTSKSLVPPSASIVSEGQVASTVRKTSLTESKFMEKVVNANLALTEGYIRLDEQVLDNS